MLPHENTNTSDLYKNVLLGLRDRYQRHYNIYMRSQLTKKQQCYMKPGAVPATPEQYYPCVDAIEAEMVAASTKLQRAVNELDDQDRSCKQTCRTTYDITEKYNACLHKCVKRFQQAVNVVYSKHYEGVIGSDPEYSRLKK